MDFLNKINMNTKVVLAIGLLLVVALAVVAVLRDSDTVQPQKVAQSPVKPTNEAPSKENVGKQVQERIDHLKAVVTKNPSDAKSAFELARTLQDGHDMQGAARYFELGLKKDPRNVQARVDYSLSLYQSGMEQKAFEQNMIVLKLDASNVHALYNLGAIYANKGVSDSARYYWKHLISSHPRDDLAQKAEQNLKQLGGNDGMMQ